MSNEFKVKNGIITSSLKFLNFEQNKPLIVNETGQVVTTNQEFWNDTDSRLYLAQDIQRCGFLNHSTTTLFFNNTDTDTVHNGATVSAWNFQLGDVSGENGWVYYINGIRCLIHGHKTISLTTDSNPPLVATYFIYINNNFLGNLSVSNSPWDLTDPNIVPVAVIRFNNALTPNYWMANERHTVLIDRKIHYIKHSTKGTQLISTGGLSGYTLNTSLDTATTFTIHDTILSDEDIIFTNSELSDTNGLINDYVVFYRTNSSTWEWKYSAFPFSHQSSSYIQYDNNGTLTTAIANKFYNTYLLYTNYLGNARFIFISGRNTFDNLIDAQSEDPALFDWTGLGIAEYVIAYQLTWSTGSSYNNTGKVRLIAEPKKINISSTLTSAVSISSHKDLLGLQGGALNEYYHLTADQHLYFQDLYANTSNFNSNSISLNNLSYSSSVTVNTSTTDSTLLFAFDGLVFGSGKFLIQAVSNSNIHNVELLVIHSGITATSVEYARLYSNESLFSIEVEKSGNSVRILSTSASSNLTKYTVSFVLNKL